MPKTKKTKKPKKKKKQNQITEPTVTYRCLQCNIQEEIPAEVIQYFDLIDPGDPNVPPRFTCEKCGGEMRPKHAWLGDIDHIF